MVGERELTQLGNAFLDGSANELPVAEFHRLSNMNQNLVAALVTHNPRITTLPEFWDCSSDTQAV